jgi:tetratricopeptide (TPR) repeat protein
VARPKVALTPSPPTPAATREPPSEALAAAPATGLRPQALAAARLAAGRLGQALEAALAAVWGEPLRESAHRVLIKVHLAEGNYGEAMRQYRLYREQLNSELGLDPSPQIQALVRCLMR